MSYKTLYLDCLKHGASLEKVGAQTQLRIFRDKIIPRLSDLKLYLNRPNPEITQANRLIAEIEETLK